MLMLMEYKFTLKPLLNEWFRENVLSCDAIQNRKKFLSYINPIVHLKLIMKNDKNKFRVLLSRPVSPFAYLCIMH